jgi:hypothetical protein
MIVFRVARRVSPFEIDRQDSGSGGEGEGEAGPQPKRTEMTLSQPITALISSLGLQ